MSVHQDSPKYKLMEPLGEGGMGVVFRAIHNELGREVAIKFLNEEMARSSPTAKARFLREAQSCVALAHPNIIKIIDVGETGGQPFFVMELLKAKDLASIRETQGALPADLATSILDQILDALDYCHSKGFFHRDIKPANIMLDESGRAVLMDFGVVKAMERTVLTEAGKVLGTPHYLAPEVLKGKQAGVSADLWSLGVTIWELLAGRLLFTGEGLNEVLKNICISPIPPIGEVRADLAQGVGSLIDRLLERDVTRRWPSAATARRALRMATGKADPDARPTGSFPRLSSGSKGGGAGAGAGAITKGVTRPSRPITLTGTRSAAVPAPPRRTPWASRAPWAPWASWASAAAGVIGLSVVGLAAWYHIHRARQDQAATSLAAPESAPRDLVFAYPDVDRLQVRFSTDRPQRWTLLAAGLASSTESAPATTHQLEIRVPPAEAPEEVTLQREGESQGGSPMKHLRPPPAPGVLARRLVQEVRAAAFTDGAVQAASEALIKALARRKTPVGDDLGKVIGEYPAQVAPLDALVHRLRTHGTLDETYRALRPHIAALLASPSVAPADRFDLLAALDRLDLADVLLVYLGREPPFRAAEARRPALDLTLAPGEVKDPTARREDVDPGLPLESADHVFGRPIALPPGWPAGRVPTLPPERVFPPRPGTSFWLVPPGVNPSTELDRVRLMFDGAASEGDHAPSLSFTTTRQASQKGLRIDFRSLKLAPEVWISLRPPGAPGAIFLREPLSGYDHAFDRVWHTLTLRGAMVPPPGRWTMAIGASFQPHFFPNLKIEKIVAGPLP